MWNLATAQADDVAKQLMNANLVILQVVSFQSVLLDNELAFWYIVVVWNDVGEVLELFVLLGVQVLHYVRNI